MPSLAVAALSLSLAQAISRGEQDGFAVRIAAAEAQSSSAQASGTRAAFLPQASLSGTVSDGGITQLGMPKAQQNYLTISAAVPLYNKNATDAATAAAQDAQASGMMSQQSVSDAMLAVVQAYENALLAQAIYASRETTVAYERRHAADVGVMVKAGAAPRYVLSESQAALAQAEQVAEDAAAQRDEAMNDLKFILAFDLALPLSLADRLEPISLTSDEQTFEARAARARPDVLAARQQVDAARSRLEAARAAYEPTVAATAQTYTGTSSPPLGTGGYQIGVTASLPVVDGGSRAAAVRAADAVLVRAQATLEQAKLAARRDIANAWREMQAALHNVQSAKKQTVAAASTLNVALLRERSGKGITLESLDALAQDAVARESMLRAIARFNIAVASVHHAAGDVSI